jgi:hypothetical protein
MNSLDFNTLEDEEGYIYMSENGVAQRKLELTVCWAHALERKILVTVDKA